MRKSYFWFIFLVFSITILGVSAQENIKDLITKEYSYKSVSGLDLNIHPSDFLIINTDGSFEYQIDAIKASGTWSIEKDILKFDYNTVDTVRFFSISKYSKNQLVLVENEKKFELEHVFSNKINIFIDKCTFIS